ncbi:MAG: hypothetical protein KC912_03480 [Proteobacteria bacterium]|nr:hypothetical protein [Pseudomonadota bacterium]
MRFLPLLVLFACGDAADERALVVLEEGLTNVPQEDECMIEPAIQCCDDITVVRLSDAAAHFDVSENDLAGVGRAPVNYLDETGVIAFTSSCPGEAASLTAIDLRIDDETGVATVTYMLVTDEGDGTTDPVRPYSVVSIARPPSEITEIAHEIAVPE